MDQIARIKWDCVEWHPYHNEPLSRGRGKRLKVFSIRGSLSSAVVPQQGSQPINRIDQTSGILYSGRLIATCETHTLFDVFTSVMSFYDWRLFLGSNGVHDKEFDGPGLYIRAMALIQDLQQRQLTHDLMSRRADKRQAPEMENMKPSGDGGLSLAVIDDEADESIDDDEVNGNKKIALENDESDELTEEVIETTRDVKNEPIDEDFGDIVEIDNAAFDESIEEAELNGDEEDEIDDTSSPSMMNPMNNGQACGIIKVPQSHERPTLLNASLSSFGAQMMVPQQHQQQKRYYKKYKQQDENPDGVSGSHVIDQGNGQMVMYPHSEFKLIKITTELTCNGTGHQAQQPGQYARALFHFKHGPILYGAKREALYKSKDNKRTIMYLKCVNYSPSTSGCKWKCRLRVHNPEEPIGTERYCNAHNYEVVPHPQANEHTRTCTHLMKIKMAEQKPPDYPVSKLQSKYELSKLNLGSAKRALPAPPPPHSLLPGPSSSQLTIMPGHQNQQHRATMVPLAPKPSYSNLMS